MAIISAVGKKSRKVKALYFMIYALLTLGAVTMVYPFLLMISGSTKSAVDIKTFNVIPRFLYNDAWLYKKYMESVFNEKIPACNYAYSNNISSFEKIEIPEGNPLLAQAATEFIESRNPPPYSYAIGCIDTPYSKTLAVNLRKFKDWLRGKYGSNIDEVNLVLGTEYLAWNNVSVRAEEYLTRRETLPDTSYSRTLSQFKTGIVLGERYYFSPIGYFRKAVLMNNYGKKIENYNKSHATNYSSYREVPLTRRMPTANNKKVKADWEYFVRQCLGLQYLKVDQSVAPAYRTFLKAKHVNIKSLNKNYNTSYKTFDEIPLFNNTVFTGMIVSDWNSFITGWKDPLTNKLFIVPLEALSISCLDFDFQDYMKKNFGNISTLNQKFGTSYPSFAHVLLPQKEIHYAYFKNNKKAIKWEFISRNYKAVAEYILFHGRGIFNTVVYCLLAVLSALIVNPLAAYAMSRYQLPSTYKLLLFMLCTMAFPPMVTAIPNFLMLRKLSLLNTFAALILPGIANGYMIFLLKGFFDSQPKELYESAQLDGASEWVLFWQITMSLSKPILAVIALQAFNAAYSNFMLAFVVCQDESMWTLMVWLYQLQLRSGQAVMYASLIIAAIPTFMIFLFCQNIIMRGIVVPSEK